MHNVGILILSTVFLCAGIMLGGATYYLLHGDLGPLWSEPLLLGFMVVANLICGLCIWLLRRKVPREAPLVRGDSRLRFFCLAIRGLPVTDRIAFLVFYSLWVGGFLLGFILPFIDPTFAP